LGFAALSANLQERTECFAIRLASSSGTTS